MDNNGRSGFESRIRFGGWKRILLPLLTLWIAIPGAAADDPADGARGLGVQERAAYQQRIDEIYQRLGDRDARKVLCENAARIFGFDLEKLAARKHEIAAAAH